MAQIRSKPFGVTKEGANVTEYILSNPGGMSVSVLDYGCVIKNIIVPAKNGPVDVVLGHDTMADYENDFTSSGSTCCGAFVGRYANRIENAVFTLGGKTYQLEKNNGENHLHGCFSRKIYEVKYFGDTLLMEAVSPDGEDGFPGTLKIAVRYTLTDDNTFRMDYRVSSDADTIVNLTNHSYFNLDVFCRSRFLCGGSLCRLLRRRLRGRLRFLRRCSRSLRLTARWCRGCACAAGAHGTQHGDRQNERKDLFHLFSSFLYCRASPLRTLPQSPVAEPSMPSAGWLVRPPVLSSI